MTSKSPQPDPPENAEKVVEIIARRAPHPHPGFRLRAWLTFQRSLDPLGPPRPLRPPRR